MDADSTFGGHFKEQLGTTYDMRVVIPKSAVRNQPTDSKLAIHHWPVRRCGWIIKRIISWPNNNWQLSSANLYMDRPHQAYHKTSLALT